MMANLNFGEALTGSTHLDFGKSANNTVAQDVTVSLGRLVLPKWDVLLGVVYRSNVLRPMIGQACAVFKTASKVSLARVGHWHRSQASRTIHAAGYEAGQIQEHDLCFAMVSAQAKQGKTGEGWQHAVNYQQDYDDGWQVGVRHEQYLMSDWVQAVGVRLTLGGGFVQLVIRRLAQQYGYDDAVARVSRWCYRALQMAQVWRLKRCLAYQQAVYPRLGYAKYDVLEPTPPATHYAHLNFACRWQFMAANDVVLVFGKRPCQPNYGTVVMVNDFVLLDPINGAEIPCYAATVATDKQSFAWSFDLSLPLAVEDAVAGHLKELEVRMNGYVWRLLVTGRKRDEVFGKRTLSLQGRSPTILLAEPYAPKWSWVQDKAMMARQIADSQVSRTGFESGFGLDWRLVDDLGWSVPAGSWAFNEQTPVQVLQAIAEAGGGFVQSEMGERKLLMLPQYPKPFWEWDKADVVINESLILNREATLSETPLFNGVYVSGEQTGVTAWVKRTGTAGDYQADMFTHALIGDEAVARNKGMAILSAGGKRFDTDLTLPLHGDTGLILPNTLVGVADWVGLTNKLSVSANWENGLKIRQSVGVERHLDG